MANDADDPTEKFGSAGDRTADEAVVHQLSYRPPEKFGLVKVGSFLGGDTARLLASVLEAEGIECHVSGLNTQALGAHFSNFTECGLEVPAAHAERAKEILNRHLDDDSVEPAPDDPEQKGESGAELVVVAAVAHPRLLWEAVAILASSRIKTYVPQLVPRGDRPPGNGDRFTVRVEADDADRARRLLAEARQEEEVDARERGLTRCPRCGRLTGERRPRFWRGMVALLTFQHIPPPDARCARCGHTWPLTE